MSRSMSGYSLRSERGEPLEEELVLQRVDRAEAQAVEQHRGRRRAPHADQDPLALAEIDDVLEHQQVARQLELLDDVELVDDPLVKLPWSCRVRSSVQAPAQTSSTSTSYGSLSSGMPFGRGKLVAQVVEAEGAALGDLDGGCELLRMLAEQLRHLVRRLQAALVVREEQRRALGVSAGRPAPAARGAGSRSPRRGAARGPWWRSGRRWWRRSAARAPGRPGAGRRCAAPRPGPGGACVSTNRWSAPNRSQQRREAPARAPSPAGPARSAHRCGRPGLQGDGRL